MKNTIKILIQITANIAAVIAAYKLGRNSGYEDGWGPFYILEEVFLILYRKDAVLVMVGNDE